MAELLAPLASVLHLRNGDVGQFHHQEEPVKFFLVKFEPKSIFPRCMGLTARCDHNIKFTDGCFLHLHLFT